MEGTFYRVFTEDRGLYKENVYKRDMPAPLPLTQTPAAQLDWSRPGTPAAPAFGDIYFSTNGGLDETRAVFLGGCGLPEGWAGQDVFTIAELGFGSGLNFLATWQAWQKTATAGQRLHFVSIEKFPFDREQLERALMAWPELANLSRALIAAWPDRVRGLHRLNFGAVTLTLVHEDVVPALDQIDGLRADAWFLDGFSPANNPGMWAADVIKSIARCSAQNARLATFSVAGAVRTALSDAGFEVTKQPGFGRKRHRLEARFTGRHKASDITIEKALIVGAGIAGRSLAEALSARQISFDLIDTHPHPAASANPAALVKPRFDLQDRPESRFFLSAYLHALRAYPEEAVISRGVRQFPKTEKDAARYAKLSAQAPLGEGELMWTGEALDIPNACVIDPKKIFDAHEIRSETIGAAMQRSDYSHVFLAAGYGVKALAPELALRFSRGQLSWAAPIFERPTAYGGYAVNLPQGALVGATHDRLDGDDPFALRAEDDARNLAGLADVSGKMPEPLNLPSRASVRVTSRDTLPILAQLGSSKWALTGLGSRGFTFAPLLAEALVAHICGEVGPLDRHVHARFSDANRFN